MSVDSFRKEELFYAEQNPLAVLTKLNDIVTEFNALQLAGSGLVSYLGNRVFAEDTNDTACKVTGVNTTRGAATAGEDNTSTGTLTAAGTYTGATDSVYTFEVVTACDAPGTITGMTFKWKKDSGEFSEAVVATGDAQAIEAGLTVAFAVTAEQDFVEGDQWTVEVTTYKVSVATGYYLQAGLKNLLEEVTGKVVPAAHTHVFISTEGVVTTGAAVATGGVPLATVVSATGSVTVTDARKFLV